MHPAGCRVLGDQRRVAVPIRPEQDESLPRHGNRRRLCEDLPGTQVADDDVLLADDDDHEGRRGDTGQAGLTGWNDLTRHHDDQRLRDRQVGVRVSRHRRDLGRQVAAGRMADQREPSQVRANVPDPGGQHAERITNGRQGVRQKFLRRGADVILIAGKDHDLAVAHRDDRSMPHRIPD